jgi:molecular chaperone GrpE
MAQADPEKAKNQEPAETEKIANNESMDEMNKALAEARSQCEVNLAGWQRAQADFVNFKRFAEQEKAENFKFANAGLLAIILPVLDDFERALALVSAEEENQKWMEGLKLIDRKFRDILEKQGVAPILALGMEFDPRFMDAVTRAKGKRDIVVQELEKGYKLQDKVIRPARVVVGSGEQVIKEE